MADVYIAEIRMFGCNFAPYQWAQCNGQLISIQTNTALFSLLGTTYGGNGQTTFGLPNLQGRGAMCFGNGPGLTPRVLGETSGSSNVTLLSTEMPQHNHTARGADVDGDLNSPSGNAWAGPGADRDLSWYSNNATSVNHLAANILSATGGSQPHNNLMPYQGINFCIALTGVFPARN